MKHMRDAAHRELTANILPFWLRWGLDTKHGGYFGRISNTLYTDEQADKGLVMTARLLWAYAAAYRQLGDPTWLEAARHARDFLTHKLYDRENGGFYWTVDFEGHCVVEKKQIYGQAFVVYALAEYYQGTRDPSALEQTTEIFELLEQHARDRANGGYLEALTSDWQETPDRTLGEGDLNCVKSMNTNLHMLEAYTAFSRVSNLAAEPLESLINVILDQVVKDDHVQLYFDADWSNRSSRRSYGHDIEASWLLVEAVRTLATSRQCVDRPWGNRALQERVQQTAIRLAEAVRAEALAPEGGIWNEGDATGVTDRSKIWWAQAEAVVGFLNAWELSSEPHYLEAARICWGCIEREFIDPTYGEWFWGRTTAGEVMHDREKGGLWKSAYHNTRCCLEILQRV